MDRTLETLDILWELLDRSPSDLPPDASPLRRLCLLLGSLGSFARWADAVDANPDHPNAKSLRRMLRARAQFLALPVLSWFLALGETRESVAALVERDLEVDYPPEERADLFRQPASAWVPDLAEWAGEVAGDVQAESGPQVWLSLLLTTCCLFLDGWDGDA